MSLNVTVIPPLAPATDFGTLLAPIAALAVGAVLVTLVVLVAGLVVEAFDARARARMRTRLHAGRATIPQLRRSRAA